jgi:tetratricopeptide (TPR) repeat protein
MLGVASVAAPPVSPHIGPAPEPTPAAPVDPFGDDPFGEMDLPAKASPAQRAGRPAPETSSPAASHEVVDDGLDLPAPRAPIRSPEAVRTAPAAPQAQERAPAFEFGTDADLPSLGRGAKTGIEFGEIDLPAAVADARGAAPRRPDSKEFLLPVSLAKSATQEPERHAPAGASDAKGFELELPSLRNTKPARPAWPPPDEARAPQPTPMPDSLEADLPGLPRAAARPQTAIGGFGEVDLPASPRLGAAAAQEPGRPEQAALPDTRAHAGTGRLIDLPSVGGASALPAIGGVASGLPAIADTRGGIDLPSPGRGGRADLPARSAPLPALSDLPAGAVEPGLPDRSARGFGELDLPGMGGAGAPAVRQQPGAGFGFDDKFDDAREIGDAVQLQTISSAPPGHAAAPALGPPLAATAPVARGVSSGSLPELPARRSKKGFVALGVTAVLVAAGASLALVADIGPYGIYWINDQLKRDEYAALVRDTAKDVRAELAADTFPAARRALAKVGAARSRAKRVPALPAYAAFVGYVRELRFGSEPDIHAEAEVLLSELDSKKPIQYLPAALAAQAAANGQLARARQMLIGESRRDPKNIDLYVLRGEMELRARDAKAALQAWQDAARLESSARTAFGLARAFHAADQNDEAEKQARLALAKNQAHVGARILLARVIWETSAHESETLAALGEVLRQPGNASKDEIVRAQTLQGDVHLARSRVSQAEAAYTEALKLDPKAGRALAGLGDALYLAGRYSEALARFEAAIQADPDDLSAKVGAAKTQIALERLDAAAATLKKLRETYPRSPHVAYWNAKVEEARGARDLAEADFKKAIALGTEQHAPASDLVESYVGLAMLLGQLGRVDEAEKVLGEARSKLQDSPAIHKALGEVALAGGRYDQAVGEFGKALELDAKDIGAKFRLGVAYRRNRQFDKALEVFDDVSQVDRDHPGLALERGVLYEESGRSDDALKAYESALAKAPNDTDLMLRVGCVKAGGGNKEAQELLRKVLDQRPESAETHHCLGRALLAEGTNLAGALKLLETAVQLDGNRPEYHLYVGWAAAEAGHTAQAEAAFSKALSLDQGLADAYWRRGVLKSRQGAFRDAAGDLVKALELRPSRFEAHAALADAYSELGREADALAEWEQAVRANPDNALWQFRYGKLLTNNNRGAQGQAHLGKAIELAGQAPSQPRWMWEAHYMMARAIGSRPECRPHWEAFLRLGPSDSPYREEAKRELKKLGHPWTGD